MRLPDSIPPALRAPRSHVHNAKGRSKGDNGQTPTDHGNGSPDPGHDNQNGHGHGPNLGGFFAGVIGFTFFFFYMKEEVKQFFEQFAHVKNLLDIWTFIDKKDVIALLGIVGLAAWIIHELRVHLPGYVMPIIDPPVAFVRRLISFLSKPKRIKRGAHKLSQQTKSVRAAIGKLKDDPPDLATIRDKANRILAMEMGQIEMIILRSALNKKTVCVAFVGMALIGVQDEAMIKALLEPHLGKLRFFTLHML